MVRFSLYLGPGSSTVIIQLILTVVPIYPLATTPRPPGIITRWGGSAFSLYCNLKNTPEISANGAVDPITTKVTEISGFEGRVTWLKDGQVLSDDKEGTLQRYHSTGDNLTVQHATKWHIGLYTCSGRGKNVSVQVKLEGIYFEDVLPNPVTIVQGHTLRIPCTVCQSGEGQPQLKSGPAWRKGEKKILQKTCSPHQNDQMSCIHTTMNPVLSTNLLIARNIQRADTGKYWCRATSKCGHKLSMFTYVDVGEAIQFVDRLPSALSYHQGEQVVLSCAASNSPKVTYQWSKGKNGHASDDMKVFPNGTMIIQNFSDPDQGLYYCQVTSKYEERKQAVVLKLKAPSAHIKEPAPGLHKDTSLLDRPLVWILTAVGGLVALVTAMLLTMWIRHCHVHHYLRQQNFHPHHTSPRISRHGPHIQATRIRQESDESEQLGTEGEEMMVGFEDQSWFFSNPIFQSDINDTDVVGSSHTPDQHPDQRPNQCPDQHPDQCPDHCPDNNTSDNGGAQCHDVSVGLRPQPVPRPRVQLDWGQCAGDTQGHLAPSRGLDSILCTSTPDLDPPDLCTSHSDVELLNQQN